MSAIGPPAVVSGLLAVAGLLGACAVLGATRVQPDRSPWRHLALACVAAGAGGACVGSPAASALLSVVGSLLVCGGLLALTRQWVRSSALIGWLEVAAGLSQTTAYGCALLLGPVRRAAHLGAADGLAVVAAPATSLLVLITCVVAAVLVGAGRDVRIRLIVGAAALLAVGDAAFDAALLRPRLHLEVAAVGVHLAVVALLVAAARRPQPALGPPGDQDAAGVIPGQVAALVSCSAVLAWDHAEHLPTPAVVAALAGILVTAVKTVLVFRHVTSLNVTRRQALTDELTGLGNRRALQGALAGVPAGARLSLVVIDLDRFKEVNDALGHAAGDDLLQQVAARLQHGRPDRELVVRQGGDEFALVRPGGTTADAVQRAAEVVAALEQPFRLGTREVTVAASAGVAVSPEHAGDAEDLQRRADSAMYRAKTAGGGVRTYDPVADQERLQEAALVADLRLAVASGDLEVHYQPQVAATTGELVGVEALVRWLHPTRGLLVPADFLELAEQHRLMDDLTALVLREALVGAKALGRGRRLRVSVNVSASSLHDERLVTTVERALLETGTQPRDLVLEITETELMIDAEVSRRVVAALVALGVGVSIDDYGTGYSSLAYLKDLPVCELKLDRSFTRDLTTDSRVVSIVRSTIDLAHSLGLQVVAEGVEDAETLERLRDLDVDTTQGYHHSRPLPVERLREWSAEHSRQLGGVRHS